MSMRRLPTPLLLPLLWAATAKAQAASAWAAEKPGPPSNISAHVNRNSATLQWFHAHPAAGGRALHYVIKWQAKDEPEATWYPYPVDVGEELALIDGLAPGTTYVSRIAAVNSHGRTWSTFVRFNTLDGLRCEDSWHWEGVMDESDVEAICGHKQERDAPLDPHPSPCSVTHVEYVLAGVAAGSTILFLSAAIVARRCQLAKRGCVAAGPSRPSGSSASTATGAGLLSSSERLAGLADTSQMLWRQIDPQQQQFDRTLGRWGSGAGVAGSANSNGYRPAVSAAAASRFSRLPSGLSQLPEGEPAIPPTRPAQLASSALPAHGERGRVVGDAGLAAARKTAPECAKPSSSGSDVGLQPTQSMNSLRELSKPDSPTPTAAARARGGRLTCGCESTSSVHMEMQRHSTMPRQDTPPPPPPPPRNTSCGTNDGRLLHESPHTPGRDSRFSPRSCESQHSGSPNAT